MNLGNNIRTRLIREPINRIIGEGICPKCGDKKYNIKEEKRYGDMYKIYVECEECQKKYIIEYELSFVCESWEY